MRRACIVRQLGRCAGHPPQSPPQCRSNSSSRARPAARRELASASYATARPFTTGAPLREHENEKDAWRLAPAQPPSVHPHPHHDAAFDSLARPEQLRTVMRLLPHSVVVCTSASTSTPTPTSPSAPAPAPVPRGMTMSSFTSLTLRPAPLVTFNVATPSRTLDAVAASRAFTIHVLSGDVAGARVADWFRRGNADGLGVFEPRAMREGCGCEVAAPGPGGGGDGPAAVAGAPLLRGPGVLYALRCRLLDDEPARGLVRVRDHVLVLAEVVDIEEGERGAREEDREDPFGLVYADRRYRQLGRTMVPGGE